MSNPWDLLLSQDVISTSRCQTTRRYFWSTACYPGVLSFERCFSMEPPDHQPIFVSVRLVGLTVSTLVFHYTLRTVTNVEGTLKASVTLLERPPQSNYPPNTVSINGLESNNKGWYFKDDSILKTKLQSLPPIHIIYLKSMLSCKVGSRGLSVPLRVIGIH